MELEPLNIGDRTLTIRAGEGSTPIVTTILSETALLSSKRRLWLEGLTFKLKHRSPNTACRFIEITSGTLCINNCRLLVEPPDGDGDPALASIAVVASDVDNVEIKNCEISAPSLTLIEMITTEASEQQRVQLTNNLLLVQRCLSFSNLNLSTCNIDLRQNAILAETYAEGHPDYGDLQLRVYAKGNLLGIDQALFHLPAATEAARLTWEGLENHYALGRWYIHGYLRRGKRYAEVLDYETWQGYVTEERSVSTAPINREDLLELDGSAFSGRAVLGWMREQGPPIPELPDAGPDLGSLGPGGLDSWSKSAEGKSWRASAGLAAKSTP